MLNKKPIKVLKTAQFFVFILIVALIISGCKSVDTTKDFFETPVLQKLPLAKYPDFTDDLEYTGLTKGIEQSLLYLAKIPPDREFVFGNDRFSAAYMIESFKYFLSFIKTKPLKNELKNFIKLHYSVYKSRGSETDGNILVTGYYEPILNGSLTRNEEYIYSVYSRPVDLVTVNLSLFSSGFKGKKIVGRFTNNTLLPYYDRKNIEKGVIPEENVTVLAWVKDPVDLFFLHIQGSGKIRFADGTTINVHYHATNGRPYRSIGRLLIDEGKIPKSVMSMQKIREYLHQYPEEIDEVLNYNPSYIFFKTEEESPIGFLGVKLVAGRSIALDRTLFPLGAMAFIETEKPLIDDSGKVCAWTDCKRFVFNHDTGGAIKGSARTDLFWGSGIYAEIAAGHMKQNGKLYFLILKPEA
ncbi:MAG: MltA domain-containing protein [Deltaproteobacteria bacterium]|nr:MltA domain-containing protein [Deltaproteobacteria bacterium]